MPRAGSCCERVDHEGCYALLFSPLLQCYPSPLLDFSKNFTRHQRNYSNIKKEALALILALQHFDVYVGSTSQPVVVLSNHNPLIFLSRMKNPNQCLMRWSLFLQAYNLEIQHICGKDNIMADALSCVSESPLAP